MASFRKKYYFLFLPFSFLYGIAITFRNFFYDKKIIKSYRFNTPIISVGNITVGGTGKTPHVEYLINMLKDNYKIVILSRGYKRRTSGFIIAQENSTVFEIGDEPKQIKYKFNDKVIVAVDKNRINAIKTLKQQQIKYDLIILDDAYQYRKIKPDISILLIDFNKPIYNDRLLPAGDLREQQTNKNRADIVIITKCPKDIKPIQKRIITKELQLFTYQKIFFTSINYGKITPVFKYPKNIQITNKTTIMLITGIANTKTLIEYLTKKTKNIIHKKYDDHYNFKHKDIVNIIDEFNKIDTNNKLIITTEKDAMRLQEFNYNTEKGNLSDIPIFYIPINVIFADEKEKEFIKIINNHVKLNKRNS